MIVFASLSLSFIRSKSTEITEGIKPFYVGMLAALIFANLCIKSKRSVRHYEHLPGELHRNLTASQAEKQ